VVVHKSTLKPRKRRELESQLGASSSQE
jgi:hypothetical protein